MTTVGALLAVVALAGSVAALRAVTIGRLARRRLATAATARPNGQGLPDGAAQAALAAGHAPDRLVDPRHPSVQGRGATPPGRPPGRVGRAGRDDSSPITTGGASIGGTGRTAAGDATAGGLATWAGGLRRLLAARPEAYAVTGRGDDRSWGGFASRSDASGGALSGRPTTSVLALGVVVIGGVVIVAGTAAAALLVVATCVGAVAAHRRRRSSWRRRRQGQLPMALERLASALRGGASVPGALTVVGDALPAPLGPELAVLGREADAGRPVTDVLDEWATAHGDAGTRLAATALVLAAAVGAAPARAADGVAATLRERADLAAERRALGAQARMSAAVLSAAPVGFAAFLGTTDAAANGFLLGTPAGWACLAVGLSLDAAGAWWMARATRGDER